MNNRYIKHKKHHFESLTQLSALYHHCLSIDVKFSRSHHAHPSSAYPSSIITIIIDTVINYEDDCYNRYNRHFNHQCIQYCTQCPNNHLLSAKRALSESTFYNEAHILFVDCMQGVNLLQFISAHPTAYSTHAQNVKICCEIKFLASAQKLHSKNFKNHLAYSTFIFTPYICPSYGFNTI